MGKNIVFDVNVYADLVGQLDSAAALLEYARCLRAKEVQHGYLAHGSPIVMMEMLANLGSSVSTSYGPWVKAIALMVLHCRISVERAGLRTVPPLDPAIRQVLFGNELPGTSGRHDQIGCLCENVAEVYLSTGAVMSAACALRNDHRRFFANFVASSERQMKDQVKSFIYATDPLGSTCRINIVDDNTREQHFKSLRSDAWLWGQARLYVNAYAQSEGETLDQQREEELTDRMVKEFRVLLEIDRIIRERMINADFDMDHPKKKRANTLWDMHIAGPVGAGAAVDAYPVLLVTNDGMMIDACRAAGCKQNVSTTEVYLRTVSV